MIERARTRMLAVVSSALFLSVLVWFNYSAVLPAIVADWGLSGTHAGIVFAAFQAGYLAAIVPIGMLVDRRSPRGVIAIGATVTGGASLLFALFATGVISGTALRFIAGVGMAGVYVPGMRFVAEWYVEADRGTAMGVYVGTFSAGSGLSFLFAGTIAAALDWRTAIAATSIGALGVAPVILGLGRDAPGVDRAEGGFDLGVLRNRAYLAAVGVYSWHNWELFGMRNWLPAFLVTVPAIAATESPAFTASTLVGTAVALGGPGNLVGGALSDRVGRIRVIAIALVVSGLISATLGLLGGLPIALLVAVVLVYGIAITMDSAPTSTTVTEVVAPERMGTALSVQSFIGFSTTVVSPVVFGWALDRGGYELAFPTLAAGAAAGLVCVGTLWAAAR
ncbi:MFS transporter [Halalkalicoccus subterraneus]|uniref:MFS transporter n=1 Tax=Halalkalicoccus subterraneus TaxID=2675002 RepID=UPI001FEA7334|nr:MFS transporter [Halalkalicoccus subterraneus]